MKKFYLFLIFSIFLVNNTTLANNIKNSAVVFMYHKFDVAKYPSTNIKKEQFQSHIEEFTKSKYNILSLNYIVDTIINDGELPKSHFNYYPARIKYKGENYRVKITSANGTEEVICNGAGTLTIGS